MSPASRQSEPDRRLLRAAQGRPEAALEWRRDQRGHAIVMPVVDGTEIDDADQLIAEGRVGSYRDIFAAGLVAVLERRLDS